MAKLIEILLVEDNPSDVLLIKEVFKELSIAYHLNIVSDGVEAMCFLNKEGNFKNSPEPSIVLLDLNLPKKTGSEVLKEMRNNEQLKHIPVIILTTSGNEAMALYNIGANSYLQKPLDFDKFVVMIKSIEDFWLKNATLPS